MKLFSETLKAEEYLRSLNIDFTDYKDIEFALNKIHLWAPSAKCFVYPPIDIVDVCKECSYDTMEQRSRLLLSLPFKNIFIEHLHITESSQYSGIWVNEISPGKLEFISINKLKNQPVPGFVYSTTEESTESLMLALNITSAYLTLLHNRKYDVGCGLSKQRIKDRTGAPLIKKIVYISAKKTRTEFSKEIGEAIDWSHRWLVMGHWRKIEGLGKNREGVYCEYGHTWVQPHEKGPKNKPLVADKVRLLLPNALNT